MYLLKIYVEMEILLLVLAFDNMESVFELDITCDSNISCHQNDYSAYKFHM